jgi:hypothetical protein
MLLLGCVFAVTQSEITSPLGVVPIYKSVADKIYYVNLEVGTPPQVGKFQDTLPKPTTHS